MSLFLTIFFLVYGGMHFYAYLKVRAAFSPGILTSIIICLFMIAMVLAPMLARVAERTSHETFAIILAYTGYYWMGAILIFFVTGVCTDFFRLFVHTAGILLGRNASFITSAHLMYFLICLGASLLVIIYGTFEARNIQTEHIVIETEKIPPEAGKIRIVQISDVHLGLIVGEERLQNIIGVVQRASPDILVSTGDLLDGQPDKVERFIEQFHNVKAPYGKYAVSGNHETYFDHSHGSGLSRELTEKAGFRWLGKDYSVHDLPGFITLVGVDDEAGRGYRSGDNAAEENICSRLNKSKFTVLLKHRPVPYTGTSCTYDLQLSGHTHNGQIFPFFIVTRLFFPYYTGLYELKNNTFLYVSRGSGTWGPPIRFFASPQVTIVDIFHKPN